MRYKRLHLKKACLTLQFIGKAPPNLFVYELEWYTRKSKWEGIWDQYRGEEYLKYIGFKLFYSAARV